jgi:hypothetical protein
MNPTLPGVIQPWILPEKGNVPLNLSTCCTEQYDTDLPTFTPDQPACLLTYTKPVTEVKPLSSASVITDVVDLGGGVKRTDTNNNPDENNITVTFD